MPSVRCECGAKYKVPETSLGKKAKCKKCSAVFTLEVDDGVIAIAPAPVDEEGIGGAFAAEAAALAHRGSVAAVAPNRPVAGPPVPPISEPIVERATAAKGFGDSVLWTILFPANPSDLGTFVVVWLVLGLSGFLLSTMVIMGLALWILVSLWYAAYRFEIVESAAGGCEGLPTPSMSTDIWDDWIAPIFKWFGSWFFVLIPTFVYIVIALKSGSTSVSDAVSALGDGIPGLVLAFGKAPPLIILLGAGLFIWPMVILCVAIGGFGTVFRIDLMVRTIARALSGYLVVLALIVGATVGEYYLTELVQTRFTGSLLLSVLIAGASLYADIVSLRAIGLYYHHFKDRFVAGWG